MRLSFISFQSVYSIFRICDCSLFEDTFLFLSSFDLLVCNFSQLFQSLNANFLKNIFSWSNDVEAKHNSIVESSENIFKTIWWPFILKVPKFFHAFHTVHSLFLYRNLDFIRNSIFIGVNRKWVWGAKKRSHTGSDEEEGTRDPNVAPTDFTSREAKVWEAKSKATDHF